MMERQTYVADLDLMARLKAYAGLNRRKLQDVHMEAIREYLEHRAAESAQAGDVIRADGERSAAQRG